MILVGASHRGADWNPQGSIYVLEAVYGIPIPLTIRVTRTQPGVIVYQTDGNEDRLLFSLLLGEIVAQSILTDVVAKYVAIRIGGDQARLGDAFEIAGILAVLGVV